MESEINRVQRNGIVFKFDAYWDPARIAMAEYSQGLFDGKRGIKSRYGFAPAGPTNFSPSPDAYDSGISEGRVRKLQEQGLTPVEIILRSID